MYVKDCRKQNKIEVIKCILFTYAYSKKYTPNFVDPLWVKVYEIREMIVNDYSCLTRF